MFFCGTKKKLDEIEAKIDRLDERLEAQANFMRSQFSLQRFLLERIMKLHGEEPPALPGDGGER